MKTNKPIALVTGVLGGIVSAAGCLVGGYWCDRMDRKTAYALYGLLQAVCAIAMTASLIALLIHWGIVPIGRMKTP